MPDNKYLVYLKNNEGTWWYFNKYTTEEGAKRSVADFLIANSFAVPYIADKLVKIRCVDGHVSYYDRNTLIENRNKK